jgi:hypothetical protein
MRVAAGFGVGFQLGKPWGSIAVGAFEGDHRHEAVTGGRAINRVWPGRPG